MRRYVVEVDEHKTVWMDWNWNKHRDEDEPALIWKDGSVVYYKNGVKHRDGKPAVIFPDGYEEWWVNGIQHRDDGPAITWPNEKRFYIVNGVTIKVEVLENNEWNEKKWE